MSSMQYYCTSEKRRTAARAHESINGIDYLEVVDLDYKVMFPDDETIQKLYRQKMLLVRLLKPVPDELGKSNIHVDGGVRIGPVDVVWAHSAAWLLTPGNESTPPLADQEKTYLEGIDDPEQLLVVRTSGAGDYSNYLFSITSGEFETDPFTDFDAQLSQVSFSFKVECPSEFDCRPVDACPSPEAPEEPLIDYLTKDYESFRRLMLDRLSVTLPDWAERSPADVGVALVEVMAYAADYLSYYQDAVATEAYLGTARRRVSVRRHARLLNYPMHDGRNARVWVHLQVNADNVFLAKGTPLVTKTEGFKTTIPHTTPPLDPDEQIVLALGDGAQVFETMDNALLFDGHNEIHFYTWMNESCCLPKGATRATLIDNPTNRVLLYPGDLLVFEEVASADSGLAADADPTRRHVVRITKVYPEAVRTIVNGQEERQPSPLVYDPLTVDGDDPTAIVEIEWHKDDALSFPLCISAIVDSGLAENLCVARGNIVLADHGWTVDDPVGLEPAIVPELGRYRPRLLRSNITQATPYDPDKAKEEGASAVMELNLEGALPAITLEGNAETWVSRRDLLGSDRFANEFVVETEDDGTAFLRFGDDILGRSPSAGVSFVTTYRVGNGREGNVGAGSIAHVMIEQTSITGVRNPLPARGGTDPEPIEQVRLYAPQAFRRQERAVLVSDYAEMAERHPEVQKAQATLRWTGSWHTVYVTIDRKGGLPVDAEFEAELLGFLDRYRMICRDLEINAPIYVPLDLEFEVCLEPGYYGGPVKAALLNLFSNRPLADGRLGVFHPDNLTFNQPVYLSKLIATATAVPGVKWIRARRFQRWGGPRNRELEDGIINIGRLEIARLDNDPSAPENGRIDFKTKGGL